MLLGVCSNAHDVEEVMLWMWQNHAKYVGIALGGFDMRRTTGVMDVAESREIRGNLRGECSRSMSNMQEFVWWVQRNTLNVQGFLWWM